MSILLLHLQHDHRGHWRVAGLLAATGSDHTVDGVGRASDDDHRDLVGGGAVTPAAACTRDNGADLPSQRPGAWFSGFGLPGVGWRALVVSGWEVV
jgi:hypothetical protein